MGTSSSHFWSVSYKRWKKGGTLKKWCKYAIQQHAMAHKYFKEIEQHVQVYFKIAQSMDLEY